MNTESIKPWEPVSGCYVDPKKPMRFRQSSWPWDWSEGDCDFVNRFQALRVTLANGQTVIVRAKQ